MSILLVILMYVYSLCLHFCMIFFFRLWGKTLPCTQRTELNANWGSSWTTRRENSRTLLIQIPGLFFCKNQNKQRLMMSALSKHRSQDAWVTLLSSSCNVGHLLYAELLIIYVDAIYKPVRFWCFSFEINKMLCFNNVIANHFWGVLREHFGNKNKLPLKTL